MTEDELRQERAAKWHLDGRPVRTLEEAKGFVDSVGFCLMYPTRPAVPVPTFVGAWVGAEERLPTQQHAYADARAVEATELMVRTLRSKAAFEGPLIDENNAFLVSAAVFPYFYALVGERNPKHAPRSDTRSGYSQVACDAFAVIRKQGPISKQKLLEELGKGISTVGLDRALAELWAKLRITRVDYSEAEGSVWDELSRWAPKEVWEGVSVSVAEALSALVSKYLDCMVAVEAAEVELFFSHFVARSKVKEAINALLAARELDYLHVGGKALLRIAPPKEAFVPRPRAERA